MIPPALNLHHLWENRARVDEEVRNEDNFLKSSNYGIYDAPTKAAQTILSMTKVECVKQSSPFIHPIVPKITATI